ncbi:MAG TPA: hypothetical protein VFP40_18400 [Terriglobales bacterium]|nr:hypothetical protein [Terriglobales bacterium]
MIKLYVLYGLGILMATGYGAYRGWTFTMVNEVKNVPLSVRDNPGSYRSIYSSYHHYTGGK